jgi:hypothetical protein
MSAAIGVKKKNKAARVLLIEKNKKLGKKLYATGNGRCNFGNTELDLSCYSSENEFFPYEVVAVDSYRKVIQFFRELGVECYQDKGYLYPASLQASTVVWALSDRLKELGVEIHTKEKMVSVKVLDCAENYEKGEDNLSAGKNDTQSESISSVKKDIQVGYTYGYQVVTDSAIYKTKNLIMAVGSGAAPSLGGDLDVYRLLEDLDVPLVKPQPALCRLKCRENIEMLSGVRAKAIVRLFCEATECAKERGEVQFTADSLSGIAVFNLSLRAGEFLREGKELLLKVELIPDMSHGQLEAYVNDFCQNNGNRTCIAMLNGIVNEKIAAYILRENNISSQKAKELSGKDIENVVNSVKELCFRVEGLGDYSESQAAKGGVDTSCIKSTTMEIGTHPGLFIAGEYADVTGKCGGYNIMWAVISGSLAGECVGERTAVY